uniref:PHD-type domain-containing protein n=1 Tax=Glossina brevipalpis TaxID=37001 RepID=A0A1A9WH93_9MUSC
MESLELFECCYDKCADKKLADRFLSCWLCDSAAHPKCAGFSGRQFDHIINRSKGLRWACPKCRGKDIDMHKLFKQTQRGFTELCKDVAMLSQKLSKYQELFNSCQYLGNIDGVSSLTAGDNNQLLVQVSANLVDLNSPALSVVSAHGTRPNDPVISEINSLSGVPDVKEQTDTKVKQ